MADVKTTYGASTTTVITLAGLAASTTGAGRMSTALDNTSNLYLDAMLYIKCALTTGTIGMDKAVYVYLYGSESGSVYADEIIQAASGTDAAVTWTGTGPSNIPLGGVISFGTSITGIVSNSILIPSVSAVFGGVMPRKWGFVIINSTNIAISGTEGASVHTYSGVYTTAA